MATKKVHFIPTNIRLIAVFALWDKDRIKVQHLGRRYERITNGKREKPIVF